MKLLRCAVFTQRSLERGILDRTTTMNLWHFLERYELGRQIFKAIYIRLGESGILINEGSR